MSLFGERLRSVIAVAPDAITRRASKRSNIYVTGSCDDRIYFITSGQVKIVMLSPAGKECLLAIYTEGDYFGESCLSGGERSETAIAMSDTVVKQMAGARFLNLMADTGLLEHFVRNLAARLVEQRQIITNLATVDCEYRLGMALLRLLRTLGGRDECGLALRISHQELSQMVGTTRPRISEFMQRFRDLGLIDTTPDCRILVRERDLQKYLETRRLEPTPTRRLLKTNPPAGPTLDRHFHASRLP